MNQKRELELFLYEVLPYVSNIEYIKELILSANDFDDLEKKIRELLEKENDITKKTDLKIVLDKLLSIKSNQ
ncbi:hypothetical protein ACPB8Q_02035 [Methanocaldococcus indicus]|uniref:hypothetical protein n=1 Tax=Methanocaldococcus indicus TaxID=213231 RepID=UPI003C6D8096